MHKTLWTLGMLTMLSGFSGPAWGNVMPKCNYDADRALRSAFPESAKIMMLRNDCEPKLQGNFSSELIQVCSLSNAAHDSFIVVLDNACDEVITVYQTESGSRTP